MGSYVRVIGLGLALIIAAGAEACVGNIGGEAPGPVAAPEGGIGISGMRRLTVHELDNTLRDILGDDSRPGAALLPEDVRAPFDNDYTTQAASRVLVEAIETLAKEAAERLLADTDRRDAIVGCAPGGVSDAACMNSFVSTFGRRALRRPLADAERDELSALGIDFAERGDDFYTGVEVVLRTLLQDSEFVYRVEVGTPEPDRPGVFRLSGFEVASRMSYMLWGGPPDDALLDTAAAGTLSDPAALRAEAERMLEDPRSRAQVGRFHALWMGFDQLPHAQDLTNRMRTETAALLDRVVFEDKSNWLELFSSQQTFIDDTLAQHYGLPLPGADDPQWVDYGGSGRKGILSHGSFLSVAGNVADTSPTKRGKLIREQLMCEKMPPPPPDVMADAPPPASEGACKWDQYEAHRTAGACRTCHQLMDPVGFGLENYDRAGKYRAHDDGAPSCTISGDGELVGTGTFNGPAELGDLLVETGALEGCLTQQLYQFTMGHPIGVHDEVFVDAMKTAFLEGDGRLHRVLVEFVVHPAFQFRKEEE